ncbi:LOG family protein [Bartonella sp. LJL80]
MTKIQSICVYCGSSTGHDETYVRSAQLIGQMMAEADIRLVYGGGTKGIMGAVARAVQEHGGKVTGIIPRFLMDKEATEKDLNGLDELIVTETMRQRKHLMFERSDAFITLPGGIGTLEEIVEMMTWAQLGHHTKPMVFANINGFWNPMVALLDHMTREGFIHTQQKVRPLVVDDAALILDAIINEAARTNPQHGPIEKL